MYAFCCGHARGQPRLEAIHPSRNRCRRFSFTTTTTTRYRIPFIRQHSLFVVSGHNGYCRCRCQESLASLTCRDGRGADAKETQPKTYSVFHLANDRVEEVDVACLLSCLDEEKGILGWQRHLSMGCVTSSRWPSLLVMVMGGLDGSHRPRTGGANLVRSL